MKRSQSTLLLLSLSLFFVSQVSLRVLAQTNPSAGDSKPAVLFVTTEYNPMYNLYLKKYLREDMVTAGFETDIALWNEITWDRVKPFNVIVIVSVGVNTAYGHFPESDQKVVKVFQQFVAEGGGLFVSAIEYNRLHVALKLLKPYGLTIFDEVVKVRDKRYMQEGTCFTNCFFAYTTNIKPSSVTKDVQGIWFPILSQKNWSTLEYIFEGDDSWKVLVKGMDYTYSEPLADTGHGYAANAAILQRDKGCVSEVPLFAIKEANPGRLAYCSISPVLTYYSGKSPGIDNVVLSKGIGERRSDLNRLLQNTFHWLAQPSLSSKQLGGFKTVPARLNRATTPPPDWMLSANLEYASAPQAFKGVLGAESNYSGGESPLIDYKNAALQSGLDYVIFLEDAARITSQRYASFVEECKRLSDNKITLIPGFHVDDESGNHWYSISYSAPYPDASFFTADGKRFRSIFDPKGGGDWIAAGRYYTSYFSFFGNYLYQTSGSPYWDFRDYCSTALFTYQGTRLIDSLPLSHFLELQSAGNMLSPVAFHSIRSVTELQQLLATQPFLTVLLKKDRQALMQEGPSFEGINPKSYVTNGPEIVYWQECVNHEYTAFQWFAWSHYRWNVRFKVRSERGLKEILVNDGPTLLRRFLPGGAKEVERELNLVHQQQKELVLVVTDMEGRRAISDLLFDASFLLKDYFLGDRYNKGVYSQQPADTEWGFSYHWMPAVPDLYFMHGTFCDDLFYYINGSELIAAGFDGPPGGKPNILANVSLDVEGQPYLDGLRFARKIDRPLASSDIIVGEAGFTQRYPEDCGRWFGSAVMSPTRASEYYEGKQRYSCFNLKYGMPGIVLVEGEVRIKKDVKMSAKRYLPLVLGTVISNKESKMDTFYTSADGRVVQFNFEDRPQDRNLEGLLPKYSYLTLFPSHWGSVTIYSLTDGLGYFYEGQGICSYGYPLRGKEIKAGTTYKYRYLAMTGPRKWLPSNTMIEQIRKDLGIGRKPEYQMTVEQGRVVSQEFLCRLDGQDEGVAMKMKTRTLTCTLPVVIENLNPHWTSILYERTQKRARPIGMLGTAAYTQLGVGSEDNRLFLGHPFTCDQKEIILTCVQSAPNKYLLDLHNPTDRKLTVIVRKSKFFDLVKTEQFQMEIQAGSSVIKEID